MFYEFGNYKTDWKFSALVYDRKPKDIYPGITGYDPNWTAYRESYYPGCGALLDVEAVPHGIPFLQDDVIWDRKKVRVRKGLFADIKPNRVYSKPNTREIRKEIKP